MRILGLMSGTSMDGLDSCLAEISINKQHELYFKIIDYDTFEYNEKIRKILYKGIFSKSLSNNYLDNLLGREFLKIIKNMLNKYKVDAIASHGQTIAHLNNKYSIQVGNPKYMNDYYNVPIIYNFRINDIQNKGNGAPLVPYLDWVLFKKFKNDTIAINIGGICNIAYIPSNAKKNDVIGFDMGPGMCLVDLFVRLHWNMKYDNNGEISKKGKINKKLLNNLMKDSFIYKKPPKSTTTEYYSVEFLKKNVYKYKKINKYDILRTLVNFTACLINKNIKMHIQNFPNNTRYILSGGGVKNTILMNDLKKYIKSKKISNINYNGINIDNKESFLMCLLGLTAIKKIPNNIPTVTGASREVICGVLYE